MWSAELLKLEKKDGNVVARVKFKSESDTFEQEIPSNTLTPEYLAEFCQRVCEVRENRDKSFSSFIDVPIGPIRLPRDIV